MAVQLPTGFRRGHQFLGDTYRRIGCQDVNRRSWKVLLAGDGGTYVGVGVTCKTTIGFTQICLVRYRWQLPTP